MEKPRDPFAVEFYEGLCRKTASIYVKYVEEEYEDIVQILHIKCWRALLSFDATKSTMTVDRYVYSCMKNQCKDLVKKKKRNELHIEDVAPCNRDDEAVMRDRFDARYLSTDHVEVYGDVDEDVPCLPSTLTELERGVVCLLFRDYRHGEIALRLGVNRNQVDRAVKAIRVKMADWAPSTPARPVPAPLLEPLLAA